MSGPSEHGMLLMKSLHLEGYHMGVIDAVDEIWGATPMKTKLQMVERIMEKAYAKVGIKKCERCDGTGVVCQEMSRSNCPTCFGTGVTRA